ncbi:MAG: hypothetical protein PF501_02030, partial [Salinisphaera sp.]|nr:hypothetical protein [Salinisphaera sp.]
RRAGGRTMPRTGARYRQVIADAEVECPAPVAPASGQRKRVAASEALALVYRGQHPAFMSDGTLAAMVPAAE